MYSFLSLMAEVASPTMQEYCIILFMSAWVARVNISFINLLLCVLRIIAWNIIPFEKVTQKALYCIVRKTLVYMQQKERIWFSLRFILVFSKTYKSVASKWMYI